MARVKPKKTHPWKKPFKTKKVKSNDDCENKKVKPISLFRKYL